jgi:two-component system NtrC family sensor kinase
LHTVVVKGAANDGHIELHVCDDCGGIDEKHLPRIFEPFYTTKQDTVATGLGLCVVERIIEHMGGTIRIESQWGKGSDFIIRLPINQDE